MKYVFIFIGAVLVSGALIGLGWLLFGQSKVSKPSFHMFEVRNGFEMLLDTGASKTVQSYVLPGSVVVNGSYFGVTHSGGYFPAGIWRQGQEELHPADMDDPNLSHIVIVSRDDRGTIEIVPRDMLLVRKWGDDQDIFQAGPLVLSGNVSQDVSFSWHALEPHERTLFGKTRSGKYYIFLFTDKITLPNVGKEVAEKFLDDPITLLNLDGGPSTAYFDGKNGFRENEKLPILFRFFR